MAPVNERTRFICLFQSADRARVAVSALEKLGFGEGTLGVLGGGANSEGAEGSHALAALGVPDRDVQGLQQGLGAGGVLVWLEAPEERSAEIERVFQRYSAEKVDEAEIETGAGAAVLPARAAGEQSPLAYGEGEGGRARIYGRDVKPPSEQDLHLRGKQRVPQPGGVQPSVSQADSRARGQEIELVETVEVPVVDKVARVVEEVHVGKVGADRTEEVQGTVRHTELEVEPFERLSGPFPKA